MSIKYIQEEVKRVIRYYGENRDKALSEDKPARATDDDGVELFSDMPKALAAVGLRRLRAGFCEPPWQIVTQR